MTQGEHVLIVDDDPEVGAVLAEYLEGEGYCTTVAAAGRDGLSVLSHAAVAMVLLDLMLPDMDGIDFLRSASGLAASPEIVIITGRASLDSAIAAMELGAAGYVTKPIDLDHLGALVARVLDRRRLALENARLQADLAEHLREAEALLAVATTVTTTLDVTEALRRVCREMARLVGADTVAVYLHDADTDSLLPRAAYHVPPEHLLTLTRTAIPLRDQGFRGSVWNERTPVASQDVANDPRFGHPVFRALPHQSGVILPLVLDAEVGGAFYLVWWTARRALGERELRSLGAVTGQVGLLLRNARLYERAQQDRERLAAVNERLTTLSDRARLISGGRDSEDVFDTLAQAATALLGGIARVWIDDPGRGALRVRATAGLEAAAQADVTDFPLIPYGQGMVGRIFESRRPEYVEEISPDAALLNQRFFRESGIRAYAAIPLLAGDRCVGVLASLFTGRKRFTPDEIELSRLLADHAATAIDNTRLYEEAGQQRTRLREIFESTSDGIMLVARDGEVLSVNRRLGELLGLEPTELLGWDLETVLLRLDDVVEDHAELGRTLRALVADPDRPAEGDLEIVRAGGRVLHWVARPARDAGGSTIALTLTLQDVTREREVSRMKSDFVSFVTHQLRTPLAGIKWMLELAGQDVPEGELRSYIEDARESTQRLITLVNELLDVSRLERGRLTITPTAVDLRALTAGVLEETAPLARARDHTVSLVDDGAPEVQADAQLLRQVVLNLVSNAIKYTLPGGTIDIGIARTEEGIRWTIHDSGVGVPREAQARLFEKFYRADNVQVLETEGTGLGLYLVRLIVERSGGRVWCESEEGKGATFAFTLPRP